MVLPRSSSTLGASTVNAARADRKLARIHGLAYKRMIPAEWHVKQYVLHYFSHPQYGQHVGRSDWQIPIG